MGVTAKQTDEVLIPRQVRMAPAAHNKKEWKMMQSGMVQTYWKCGLHFDEMYKHEIKHGLVNIFTVQIVMEDRCEDCNHCEHDGEDCDGHRYCEICGSGPLTEGWCFEEDANYRCPQSACEPKDLWIAGEFCKTPQEAYEASERHGGGICYYTEWDEGEFCECSSTCKCRNLTLQRYPIYFDATMIHKVEVLGRGKYGALAVINSQQGRLSHDDFINSIWGSTSTMQEPHRMMIEEEVLINPKAGRVTAIPTPADID